MKLLLFTLRKKKLNRKKNYPDLGIIKNDNRGKLIATPSLINAIFKLYNQCVFDNNFA
jgi:hypothetical protein